MSLRTLALEALCCSEPEAKCLAVNAIADDTPVDCLATLHSSAALPGRSARPELVSPAQLKTRSVHTRDGHIALIHALAHIELNAVNLALDILWRFADMPEAFYRDWLRVAKEEAYHFGLLRCHLETLGCHYGDLPAHNGLWEMVEKTRDDVLARLALVPRTLEARGLDASLPIRDKLKSMGDKAGAGIIDIILRDEIGHVAIGNRWYRYVCSQRGLEPIRTYAVLAEQYQAPRLRGPFNLEARRAAGFDEEEIAALQECRTAQQQQQQQQ